MDKRKGIIDMELTEDDLEMITGGVSNSTKTVPCEFCGHENTVSRSAVSYVCSNCKKKNFII